jgi:hypothetical protein
MAGFARRLGAFCVSATAVLPWTQTAVAQYLADVTPPIEAAEPAGEPLPLVELLPQEPGGCNCAACQTGAPADPACTCKTCCHGHLIDWAKYPETIHPMPRPGIFALPVATGPGYFSLCDELTGQCRDAPPKSGYVPFAINAWPFFDADWRYVEAIPPAERTFVERLKRMHLNDCTLFSTGGEFWTRYHHEPNSRLTETTNTFRLDHVRIYGDLWYSDWLRVYGEYVWADIFNEELSPVLPDVDRGDILDLFVDVKIMEVAGRPVYARGGRQELLYGSQRLLSPLPWANKRHTFQGVKIFRQGESWDFDAFWTQYVPPDADDFDTVDSDQNLAGSWLTYRPEKGELVDLYYLLFDNENRIVQQDIVRAPFQLHTVGSRWAGDQEGWLWDFEGALQFGQQDGSDVFAAMGTAGLGRSWPSASLSPTLWLYYDYASGDSDPDSGDVHTFNQLFPFGHYYMGWMDLVGRQNIHDVNAHLYLFPAPWITVWLQYHHFWLDEAEDALYNAGGVAFRRDPTGASGTNVGDEIDVILNFHLARNSDVLVSYNKLYGGGFLENTEGPDRASDAEATYLMFQQRW